MHEMAIAQELLDKVLHIAQENHAFSVSEIEVELGIMCLVVPEALQESFHALSHETPAQGAKLIQTEVPLTIECKQCGRQTQVELGNLLCPQCQTGDVAIVTGNDIILKTVICETAEDKQPPI